MRRPREAATRRSAGELILSLTTLSNNCQKVWRKGWAQGIMKCPKSNSLLTRWLPF
jgi:hypothetical protein